MKHFDIYVEDYGLLKKAEITLKPLTIFLGENNTGKSYIAQLIYALTRSVSHLREARLRFTRPLYSKERKYDLRTVNAFKRRLPHDWEKDIISKRHTTLEIPFGSLPGVMADDCIDFVKKRLFTMSKYLGEELMDAYGVRISELNTKLTRESNLKIRIKNKKPRLDIAFSAEGNRLRQHDQIYFSFRGSKLQTMLRSYDKYLIQRRQFSPEEVIQLLMFSTVQLSMRTFTDIFPDNAYYFPAARSGILQGQKLIARAGLRSLKRAGLESISMSKLPGVVVDFLDQIYSIDKDETSSLGKLSKDIENSLTTGAIGIIEKKEELPEIYFNVKNTGRFPLHRTSSMVSELAPIILMLRYLIEPGDIIILEEPESHLHPKLQRKFAKIIANFVHHGLIVLITTHSDYFVEQLSNIVALSSQPANIKTNLGYQETDLIHESDVSAYQFKHGEDGFTIVNRLRIGPFGISEAGFGDVAESLYEESVEAKRSRQ